MSESLITKKAIAAGLKELTKKKSFEKITVSDITEICGLNRQTFYYHFQDKFELVNWIYYNEAISVIVDELSYENWNEKVLLFLKKMKSEDYFYIGTLKLAAENEFREYLFRVTCELFGKIIGRIHQNENLSPEDKKFISEFYAFGIVGVIIAWAQNGMKETPEYLAKQFDQLAYGTEKFASDRFREKNS